MRIYHTRVELQKCQLETEEQRRKNKLNLPQTAPRGKRIGKYLQSQMLITKPEREPTSH